MLVSAVSGILLVVSLHLAFLCVSGVIEFINEILGLVLHKALYQFQLIILYPCLHTPNSRLLYAQLALLLWGP